MARQAQSSAESPMPQPMDGARLLAMARDRSIAVRESLAGSVSLILAGQGNGFSESEYGLMNDILRTLIRDVERSVRQTLASNLAASNHVPDDVLEALINDDIEVAYPVLADSPLLMDLALEDVIRNQASGHRIAIAMRQEISAALSDVMIETADVEAITCLINNSGAEISEAGFGTPVDDAQTIKPYRDPLCRRLDLKPVFAMQIAGLVSDALRENLVEQFNIPAESLEAAIKTATRATGRAMAGGAQNETGDFGSKGREIKLMVEALRRQEWPQFEAAMVRLTAMRPRRLREILYEPGGERLAVLCKACGISKSNFAAIYIFSRKANPAATVVDADTMHRTLTFYEQISKPRAEKALARWRASLPRHGINTQNAA